MSESLGSQAPESVESTGTAPMGIYVGLVAVIVGLDAVTKYIVQTTLVLYHPVPVLGDFFRLTYIYNPGAAFGLHLGPYSRWIFMVLTIGALFILPFLLFSATSGQLADKYDKAVLIRFVKWLEIAIMLVAGWGFVAENVPVLLACVFLMGLHSTLFGPVKFAYLPQHLGERELTGGNGMVEMGTFVAILLGNVVGGLLIAVPELGARYVAWTCLALAVLGRVLSQWVPASPS